MTLLYCTLWAAMGMLTTYLWMKYVHDDDHPELIGLSLLIHTCVWPASLPIVLLYLALQQK